MCRNPGKAVEKLSKMKSVGQDVARLQLSAGHGDDLEGRDEALLGHEDFRGHRAEGKV